MNLVWAALIVIAATSVAVTAMLLVRRRAPEGSRFQDGDRASGVFGVLATGFSVLLGLVVFLAFESYDQSRAGAEQEALVLVAAGRDRPVLRAGRRRRADGRARLLRPLGRLRRVAAGGGGHPRATRSTRGASSCSGRSTTVQPQTASEEAAYGKWLDQTSDREAARIDRIHGAVGVIPAPLWVVLFVIVGVIFVFMLFFADSGEGAATQAVLMGSVTVVVALMLLLINFLDNPFHDGCRRRPTRCHGTVAAASIDEALQAIDENVELPCDASGQPGVNAPRKRDWVELAATVLLAIAAVSTAWSSYQATRWNGEQAKTASRVNKTRIEADRAVEPRERAAAGRRRHVHAVGGRVRARRGRSS